MNRSVRSSGGTTPGGGRGQGSRQGDRRKGKNVDGERPVESGGNERERDRYRKNSLASTTSNLSDKDHCKVG